ncbi:MAG: hypothetical protein QM680_12535 [Luteolibacter sp.]
MKPFTSFFLALFAVSCADKTPPVVKVEPSPGRHLSRAESDRIRLPETIKAYPLGRYTDPNHRGVMHEAHTIYRVETTPRWNLVGRGRSTAPVTSATTREDLSANELRVELNRQRKATQAVIQSGENVSNKLTDLATSLRHNQQALAGQHESLRKQLLATGERLDALEGKVKEAPTPDDFPKSDRDSW